MVLLAETRWRSRYLAKAYASFAVISWTSFASTTVKNQDSASVAQDLVLSLPQLFSARYCSERIFRQLTELDGRINFRTVRLKPTLCFIYFCRLIEHRQYHFLYKHRPFVPFEFRVLRPNILRCAGYRNYPVFTTDGCDQPQQQLSA